MPSPPTIRAAQPEDADAVREIARGRVLGCYVLRENRAGRGAHVANASYAVSEHARGSGVGEALGLHSLAEARGRGFPAMQFNFVVSTNTGAVALWRKLGFAIVGTLPAAAQRLTSA